MSVEGRIIAQRPFLKSVIRIPAVQQEADLGCELRFCARSFAPPEKRLRSGAPQRYYIPSRLLCSLA
jgi:hypothetical protein